MSAGFIRSSCCLLLARIISTAAWLQSTKISLRESHRNIASALRSNNWRNMGSLWGREASEALGLSSRSRAVAGEFMMRGETVYSTMADLHQYLEARRGFDESLNTVLQLFV